MRGGGVRPPGDSSQFREVLDMCQATPTSSDTRGA